MKRSLLWLFTATIMALANSSCHKDNTTTPLEVKARFTAENDDADGFKVNIHNDSENATEFAWDFGDGNTGTQSDTLFSYTYASAGTYTITLTVKNGDQTATSQKDVVISGQTFKQFLSGSDVAGKVWQLEYTAGMVMLNPDNYNDWWYSWTSNHGFPVDQRNTVRHHEYIFKPDGSFEFKTHGYTIRPGTAAFFGNAPDPKGWPDDVSWVSGSGKDCSTWGNNANLTFKLDATASYYPDCKFGKILIEGKGGHIGPMDSGTETVVDEPAAETFYEVYYYADGGDQPDTLILFTPWGGNENGIGAERGAQIGRITLVSYKSAGQIPADEVEVVVQKPLKSEDIFDDFDHDATNITWVLDNSPTLFDENFANPFPGGIDSSAVVAKYVRGTMDYANVQFELPFRMDLTARNVFKMKLYVDPAAAVKTVSVKLQDTQMGANAWQTQNEKKIQNLTAGEWLDLSFDFSDSLNYDKYDKIVVQFGDEGTAKGDGTFYFDDFGLQ